MDHNGNRISAMGYYDISSWRTIVIATALWAPTWWLITRAIQKRYRRKMSEALAREGAVMDELGIASG